MITLDSLVDFLWKLEGNRHAIDRKFVQKNTQSEQVGVQVEVSSSDEKSALQQSIKGYTLL